MQGALLIRHALKETCALYVMKSLMPPMLCAQMYVLTASVMRYEVCVCVLEE
jgi:hypothetical protein